MCNEACEEGHLHRTYECPVFAKAFDKDAGDGDDNNLEVHDDQMQRKLPKIENMYSACPLYTCISPLRLLLRQKMASTDIKEQVGWVHFLKKIVFPYHLHKSRQFFF